MSENGMTTWERILTDLMFAQRYAGGWVCGSYWYQRYTPTFAQRISLDLKKKRGYQIESRPCKKHEHKSTIHEYRLMTTQSQVVVGEPKKLTGTNLTAADPDSAYREALRATWMAFHAEHSMQTWTEGSAIIGGHRPPETCPHRLCIQNRALLNPQSADRTSAK